MTGKHRFRLQRLRLIPHRSSMQPPLGHLYLLPPVPFRLLPWTGFIGGKG